MPGLRAELRLRSGGAHQEVRLRGALGGGAHSAPAAQGPRTMPGSCGCSRAKVAGPCRLCPPANRLLLLRFRPLPANRCLPATVQCSPVSAAPPYHIGAGTKPPLRLLATGICRRPTHRPPPGLCTLPYPAKQHRLTGFADWVARTGACGTLHTHRGHCCATPQARPSLPHAAALPPHAALVSLRAQYMSPPHGPRAVLH